MIGYVGTGASFLDCLAYCLEDKQELSNDEKVKLAISDGLQHLDRAEVLAYNKCGGDKYELAEQFREVARLSRRVEKPVFHFALRLAPGDRVTINELIDMGEACVNEFGVAGNQYIIVLHRDTPEPHIHIVANRVGLDGKVASDSNSYKKMAALCRKLEKQLNLTEVLSPRAFLSAEERKIPRLNKRKEQLKTAIRETLQQVSSYDAFEQCMKALGYQVLKGRGIAFVDDKKVRFKGSEVGFSLAKIEAALQRKKELAAVQAKRELYAAIVKKDLPQGRAVTPEQQRQRQVFLPVKQEYQRLLQQETALQKILYELFKPEYVESLSPE